MKAVLFRGPNEPLRVEERPLPRLDEGDVLLKIDRCGVCASDLMAIDGVATDYSPPVVLGHEIAAHVVDRRGATIPIGTRVSVDPMITCGMCVHCRRGERKYCAQLYGIGHDIDGGFAEYMVAPRALVEGGGLLVAPETVSPEELMFVEPLGCVLAAWHETPFRESVAILGAGPIGLLFTQLACQHGLMTVVLDPVAHRRASAEAFGAALTVPPDEEGIRAARDRTDGGADTVLVATSHSDAIEAAFSLVRRGGDLNFFGLAPKGRMLEIELEQLHFQGHTIRASWAFSRRSLEEARDRIVGGQIDLGAFVTRRFALAEADEAITYARERRGIKAVFDPSLNAS